MVELLLPKQVTGFDSPRPLHLSSIGGCNIILNERFNGPNPFPIVMPFRAHATSPDIPTLAIEAAATTASNALDVANAFTKLICQRGYGTSPATVFLKRARIGAPGAPINGPMPTLLVRPTTFPSRPWQSSLTKNTSPICGVCCRALPLVAASMCLLMARS